MVAEASLPRPPFGTFRLHLAEDPIAVEQRLKRQQASGKFPTTFTAYDTLSFQEKDEKFFRRFSDKGERRADAPRRSDTTVIDPISGFTSVGADVEDGNYAQIEPFVNKDHRPQSAKPYGRPIISPIPELRAQNAPWDAKNIGKVNHFSGMKYLKEDLYQKFFKIDCFLRFCDLCDCKICLGLKALNFLYPLNKS